MKSLPLQDILEQIGGKVIHGKQDVLVRRVIKMRKLLRNGSLLFYANHYYRMDWNMFKPFRNCIVVTENPPGTPEEWGNVTVVQVPNLDEAYWKFVEYYRGLFSIPVFAITGTCGKTTVKEMISQILAVDRKVVSTYRNKTASGLNLLYLTEIDDSTQVGVFETGVYFYPNDLLSSCRHLQPTIGIITNIDVDHIEGCGSFENYLKAKAEMLPGLKYQGTLILNRDDEHIATIDLTPYQGKIVYFGQSEQADYQVSSIRLVQDGMKFKLMHKGKRYWFFVPEYGVHNVYNALAAIAGLHELGMSFREIRTRLCLFKNLTGHFTVFTGINGTTVVDDTWKATPISVESAVKTLQQVAGKKRKVMVSGRMASDVADYLEEGYKRIGRLIAETGVDVLITRGEEAKLLAEAAIEAGMKPEQIIMCRDDFDEVFQALTPYLDPKTILLVKSSYSDPSKPLLAKLRGETEGSGQ